jgi:hypothetical protein
MRQFLESMKYREGMVHLKGLRWTIEWLAMQNRVGGQSYIILPRMSSIVKGKSSNIG